MANEEHLALLKQGADVWNQWRKEHPEIRPNLRRVVLRAADLNGADLNGADLSEVQFIGVSLRRAKLNGADLSVANLILADLSEAQLSRVDFNWANLFQANLSRADLSETNLIHANLSEANLNQTNLSEAIIWGTILTDIDMRQVIGMESVHHSGPSYIDIQTIYRSQGQIPEVFLRGAGVPENFIEYMRSLTGQAFEYYSCFISHSSKDKDFCQRLYNDLQMAGVRCWLDSEDLKIGEKFWERIDESIRLHDKLLVVLSAHSVESAWVEDEVMRALEKEAQPPARTVLFPIRLDDAVMTTRKPWASNIRLHRHIGDFRAWKDHDAYQAAFTRLLRDLKAEGSQQLGSAGF